MWRSRVGRTLGVKVSWVWNQNSGLNFLVSQIMRRKTEILVVPEVGGYGGKSGVFEGVGTVRNPALGRGEGETRSQRGAVTGGGVRGNDDEQSPR